MKLRYAVPAHRLCSGQALGEYILNRQRAEYEYKPARYGQKIVVVPEQKPILRPIEDPSVLESTIFRSYLNTPSDAWDFIADQATLEKYQLRILLSQLAARHNISAGIRNELYDREREISSRLLGLEPEKAGMYFNTRLRSELEKRLEAVNQERSMESVGLWRDSQKVLTDIFDHWTAYANLTRRQRVMNSDV